MGKKPKISSPVDGSSSEMESDEDLASDEEDSEIPPKTTIQKPNSSVKFLGYKCNGLQMSQVKWMMVLRINILF